MRFELDGLILNKKEESSHKKTFFFFAPPPFLETDHKKKLLLNSNSASIFDKFLVVAMNNNNKNDLSSEKIAKALKGAGLSVEERIVTATEAWSNNQLFFPNKDDFLFEWLCTALTKTKVKS